MKIKEYIEFGTFNSKAWNLYLVDRNAPTPDEKEIIEDIPFMQGVLDFSSILGARIYETREIEYDFKLVNSTYDKRKDVERSIKQQLMHYSKERLYDTHDNSWFWLGKCKSVSVKQEPGKRSFIVTIIFTVYPFMFTIANYFDDVWDSFDFENGIAGYTRYVVKGYKEIILINTGSLTINPEITVSDAMTLKIDREVYRYGTGSNTGLSFRLVPGVNKISIEGNGVIRFRWHSEVMG